MDVLCLVYLKDADVKQMGALTILSRAKLFIFCYSIAFDNKMHIQSNTTLHDDRLREFKMKKWFIGIVISFAFFTSTIFASSTPLPANEVFQIKTQLTDPNNFAIVWSIKKGYFLYTDRLQLACDGQGNITIGSLRFPQSQKKTDQLGQVISIYRDELSLQVPVLGQKPGEATLSIHYQGCSDEGFCYPPEDRQIHLAIDKQLALVEVELNDIPEKTNNQAAPPKPDHIESLFNSEYWYVVLLTFYGLGLLLAFTPCVLPMIPVLSGIIVGHGHISTKKAFGLSCAYVLSMATTYAALGIVVAQLGKNLQIVMQSPAMIISFAGLFVILSLSMFGLYDLKLPVSWQAKLAQFNRAQSTGHYLSAALMGCLSSLVLSPCVTPPLVGALSYIAKSEDLILGAGALFALGLGMGTPLLLIGTSAGKFLPKAGHWMNAIKSFFGFLLLGMAIYLLDRIAPPSLIMALTGVLLIIAGIYADALTIGHTHREKLKQACGIVFLVYGLVLLIGASMGSTQFLQPLAGIFAKSASATESSSFVVTTPEELEQRLAQSSKKPFILDFYADWCTSCKILEKTLWQNPDIKEALHDITLIKVDVTESSADQRALLKQYHVIAPPTFIFLNKEGQEIPRSRLVGEISAQELMHQIQNK